MIGQQQAGPAALQGTPLAGTAVPGVARDAVAAAVVAAAPDAGIFSAPVDTDLVLAQAMLSGVLSADPMGLLRGWAVAVLRGVSGTRVVITSNEGSWIPRGLFLPTEVWTPWRHEASAAWRGLADPGRILLEYAHRLPEWRVVALASTEPVAPYAGLGMGIAQVREGNPAINLRSERTGTAHRLHFTCPQMEGEVAAIGPEAEGLEALGLAYELHTRVPAAGLVAPGGQVTAAQMRQQILDTLNSNRPALSGPAEVIPDKWWATLRELDGLMEALAAGSKIRVGDVNLGDVRAEPTAPVHRLLAERRANEAVLLLENADADRLRDVYFAYNQEIAPRSQRAEVVGASA